MRNFVVLSLLIIAVVTSNCGNSTRKDAGNNLSQSIDTGTVEIVFDEYEHDFGKVVEGEKIGYIFNFKNKGSGSLVLESVTSSCGCTIPKYSTRPIPAGGDGKIEIVFDTSGREGMQTKTIKVRSNASIPVLLLKITAEVESNNN